VQGEGYVFYTDDSALFSATRRLARDQDPTQPVIDRELGDQGEDVVFEPVLQVTKALGPPGWKTEFALRAQGFIFADNSRFNHGTLGLQATHDISPSTFFIVRYFFAPNLLLGENEEKRSGLDLMKDEEVTTHYWAGGLGHELSEALILKLFGRYGMRSYNGDFSQRDTHFWTIGTHADVELTDTILLLLGYHYERGLAEGRKEPELKDDLSYFNHYIATGLEIELCDQLTLELGIHYERNGWTTGIVGDRRNGEHEDIVQGDIALRYQVTEAASVTAGFQGAHRKESFEEALQNFNGWVGGQVVF